MKKIFWMMAMAMMMCVNSSAEEFVRMVPLNRTFSTGGTAVILSTQEDIAAGETRPMTWELKNDPIGERNYITLRIYDAETGYLYKSATWKSGEQLIMAVGESGKKSYVVSDDDFIHLMIVALPDLGDGSSYAIRLCSVLRE